MSKNRFIRNTCVFVFSSMIALTGILPQNFVKALSKEQANIQEIDNLNPVIETIIPKYASIKIDFTPVEGTSTYDIFRCETENGEFEKIGSTDISSYVDKTGIDMIYYYQIRNHEETQISNVMANEEPTGIKAMKDSAVLFQDTSEMIFDGNTLLDVSDQAAYVNALHKGSVVFRFKTTDKTQSSMILMGKTENEQVAINGAVNKAAFYLDKAGNDIRVRADMKHTRASVANNYADGNWHTVAIMNDTTNKAAFRFTIDGKEMASFDAGNNNSNVGFFSTVNQLTELTIGGYYNGNTENVSNGFRGEIDYIAILDDVLTSDEASSVTGLKDGTLCDISSTMFDQSKDNTWIFSGGAAVEGGYLQTQGIRNYMNQFEEYVRWTKSNGLMGRQRYMINTGSVGTTLKYVAEQFEKHVGIYDPKALAVMVGEEDYIAGEAGLVTFNATLHALVAEAMALRDATGYLVIQTPYAQSNPEKQKLAEMYTNAVLKFYKELRTDQKRQVMVINHFKLTNNDQFKRNSMDDNGQLNALGHFEIAKEFSQEVFGSVDGFPVNENSFSQIKTDTPSQYFKNGPSVDATDKQLTISIPDDIRSLSEVWSYNVTIDETTISKVSSDKQVVFDQLSTGASYVIRVTSQDGTICLSNVKGNVKESNKAEIISSKLTELSGLQEQIANVVQSEEAKTWLFVGDSITHGALHTKGYDSIHQTFEKYVHGELGRRHDVVINTAVSGATTAEQEANSYERFDKYDADVVIVMLGTNDASNAVVPLEQYRINLINIVNNIHEKGAVAVLRTPNPLRAGDNRATNLPKYAQVIREIAEEKGAILIDHYAEWSKELTTRAYLWQDGYWNNDAIHPNANGQLNMAQSLIRGLGLFDEQSQICNLSYVMQQTMESSQLTPEVVGAGQKIAVNVKDLAQTYGSSFGSITLEAKLNGVTYSTTVSNDATFAVLHELPSNETYEVVVKANLLNTNKTVSFAKQSIQVHENDTMIGLNFTPKRMVDVIPETEVGSFYVGALAPEGDAEYSLVAGEGDRDNAKFKLVGDTLFVKEALLEANVYTIRVRVCINGEIEERTFDIKAANKNLIVNESNVTIGASKLDVTSNYLNDLKTIDEGTFVMDFVATGTGSVQSIMSISNKDDNANAKNTHFHVFVMGSTIGFELRNASDAPTFNYTTARVSNVIHVGKQNKVAVKADRQKNVYAIFVNGEKVMETNAEAWGGFKFLSDIPSLNSVTIGATNRAGMAYPFEGTIYKLQVYGSALRDEEIETMTYSDRYTPNRPFHSNDTIGSNYYRIPSMITTSKGTIVSAIDARFGGTQDSPNNIDTAVKTSYDNGKTWGDSSLPFHFDDFADSKLTIPFNNRTFVSGSASYIDPALLEDKETGRIFTIVDAFPSKYGSVASQNGSGYTEIDGIRYLMLKKQGDLEFNYTLRDNNVIYDAQGNATEYSLNGNYEVQENGVPLTVKQKDVTFDGTNLQSYETNQDVKMNVMYDTSLFQVFPTSYLRLKYSDDQGKTWSDFIDLNSMLKDDTMGFLGVGPGRGLQITTGEYAGRLLFQVYELKPSKGNDQFCHTIYSDDHGETWQMGGSPAFDRTTVGCMSESQLIELPDGSIEVFARTTKGKIATAYSRDGGITWTDGTLVDELTITGGSGCQMSIINYDGYIDGKKAVILSSPIESSRKHGVMRVGLIDNEEKDGKDFYDIEWKYVTDITSSGTYFAYSCLTQLPDGNIGVIYEKENTAQFFDCIMYNTLRIDEITNQEHQSIVNAIANDYSMGHTLLHKDRNTYTMQAIAADGYEFEEWLLNGKSTGITEANYQFELGGFLSSFFSNIPVYNEKTLQFTAKFHKKEIISETAFMKDILKKVIDKASQLTEEDLIILAPVVSKLIVNQRDAAILVYDNENATMDECLEAWLSLANALQYADFKADKEMLNTLIDACESLDLTEYQEGVIAFKKALADAKLVLANDLVLQETIDLAYQGLEDAKANLLKGMDVNKSTLSSMIKDIVAQMKDEALYQKNDAWTMFMETLAKANAMLEDETTTQTDINQMVMELAVSFENIRLLPNENLLAYLVSFVEQVHQLDPNNFSMDEYAFLMDVQARASALMNEVTIEQYEELQPDLKRAISIMKNNIEEDATTSVKKQPVEAPKQPTRVVEEDVNTLSTNKHMMSRTTPATGDVTSLHHVIGFMFVSGCMIVLRRKRKD